MTTRIWLYLLFSLLAMTLCVPMLILSIVGIIDSSNYGCSPYDYSCNGYYGRSLRSSSGGGEEH